MPSSVGPWTCSRTALRRAPDASAIERVARRSARVYEFARSGDLERHAPASHKLLTARDIDRFHPLRHGRSLTLTPCDRCFSPRARNIRARRPTAAPASKARSQLADCFRCAPDGGPAPIRIDSSRVSRALEARAAASFPEIGEPDFDSPRSVVARASLLEPAKRTTHRGGIPDFARPAALSESSRGCTEPPDHRDAGREAIMFFAILRCSSGREAIYPDPGFHLRVDSSSPAQLRLPRAREEKRLRSSLDYLRRLITRARRCSFSTARTTRLSDCCHRMRSRSRRSQRARPVFLSSDIYAEISRGLSSLDRPRRGYGRAHSSRLLSARHSR